MPSLEEAEQILYYNQLSVTLRMVINRNSTSIDSISCLSVNETVVMEMVYGAAYVLKALYTLQH